MAPWWDDSEGLGIPVAGCAVTVVEGRAGLSLFPEPLV